MSFLVLLPLLLWGGGGVIEIPTNPTIIDGITYWKSTTIQGRKWAIIPSEKLPKLQGKFDKFNYSNIEETLLSDEDNKAMLEYINETLKHITPGFRVSTHNEISNVLESGLTGERIDWNYLTFLSTNHHSNSLFLRSDGKLIPIDISAYTDHYFPENEFKAGYFGGGKHIKLIVISGI